MEAAEHGPGERTGRGPLRRVLIALVIAVPLTVLPLLVFAALIGFGLIWEPQIDVDDSVFKPFPAGWEVLAEYDEGYGQGRGPEVSLRVLLLRVPAGVVAVRAAAEHFRARGFARTIPRSPDSYYEVSLTGARGSVQLAPWRLYRDLSLLRRTPSSEEELLLAAAERHDAAQLVLAFVTPEGY